MFPVLDPQDEVGPSISSSVVLCFFVLLVYIVVLVLVVCLCPSSVHVVGINNIKVVYVLLTVHLIIIFVNNQLDAQFFFLYLFIPILYMFRATKCSS